MAEQTQIDFSQLEGVTPVIPTESVETITTETVQPTVDIQTTTPTKEESIIDFSQLEGVTPVTQEQPPNRFFTIRRCNRSYFFRHAYSS